MNSYWIESTKNLEIQRKLDNNYNVDVCIIGAGMVGLSTGYYLAKKGLKMAILDKDGIGKKASGHTTAKITYQHGLKYNYLINTFGLEFAYKYYKSNKNAIEDIKKIIDEEKIDCDFEYQNNYIYCTEPKEVIKIKNEINALNQIVKYENKQNDKNNPQFITNCGLPFKILGGIETKKQAEFHPRKYMLGLAKSIEENNGLIFTNSLVNDVKKFENGYISYCGNYNIKSKYVVIASHYPFINFPGFYFSKMYQVTSYALGIDIGNKLFDGMYISSNEPTLSFRSAKYKDKRLLILGGGNHKTGFSPESENTYGYKFLEVKAKELFPNSQILYKWNTRDCISLDKVPYIGEFSEFMPNVFVATGFNKWGMTSSNVAANIISDSILGEENDYKDIYNSKRMEPIKNKTEVKNMIEQVTKSFITSRIKIPKENIDKIKKGNGGIIKIEGKAVGIYKDEEENIYAVNPTCTHLGCLLTWNNIDKTWDCPCHGSRFDYKGKNLYDPAFKDLQNIEVRC